MIRAVTCLLVALAVAASAQTVSPPGPQVCSRGNSNDNPSMLPYLSFTTSSSLYPASTPATEVTTLNGGQGYTRLKMRFYPCAEAAGQGRLYDKERRDWTKRLFAGKTVSKLLTVKTSIASPQVSTTNNVATIGRDSSRKKGEAWSTEISNSRWLTPYFRINGESVVNVDINLSASTDYTSSVSADALDLVKRATGVISPSSTLITSLNKDRFNDASNFVDSSINAFFKQSVIERSVNDFQVRTGNTDLGAVVLHLPVANDTVTKKYDPVGIWVISTDKVIASIFQPAAVAAIDYASLSVPTVMNFLVAPGQTLEQALASKANVAAARDALLKARNDEVDRAAAGLCRALATEGEAIGLTPIDVEALKWAYRQSLGLTDPSDSKLATACSRVPAAPRAT